MCLESDDSLNWSGGRRGGSLLGMGMWLGVTGRASPLCEPGTWQGRPATRSRTLLRAQKGTRTIDHSRINDGERCKATGGGVRLHGLLAKHAFDRVRATHLLPASDCQWHLLTGLLGRIYLASVPCVG